VLWYHYLVCESAGMTECTVVNYNIMARSSHAIVRDGHISRLTLAMYWNTFIKIVFGRQRDPLLKERRGPPGLLLG
jgi:hypothetical protein